MKITNEIFKNTGDYGDKFGVNEHPCRSTTSYTSVGTYPEPVQSIL